MTVQEILLRYRTSFLERCGAQLSSEQRSAFNALAGCRQGQYGDILWGCDHCTYAECTPCSCGHRACNQCQQQTAEAWLQRQQQKQLPTPYFLVTFTLPHQLRTLAQSHQRLIYDLLMRCACDTLKTFAQNDKRLQGDIGQCAVLHTHTRRLDYHPHVHVVVPGGSVHRQRREWRKVKRYLFNGKALAKVFRGCFLKALAAEGFKVHHSPQRWIVQCQAVGQGVEALQYLARYLYRGVISNKNILADDGRQITFRFRDSQTKTVKTRTLSGEDFIWLLLQHVLPKGFRRSRDYGFLHGNAKALVRIIQWVFRIQPPVQKERRKIIKVCPCCQSVMKMISIRRNTAPG